MCPWCIPQAALEACEEFDAELAFLIRKNEQSLLEIREELEVAHLEVDDASDVARARGGVDAALAASSRPGTGFRRAGA